MKDVKRSENVYRMGLRRFIWILILAITVQGCHQTEWTPPPTVPVLVEGFELFPDGSPVPPGTEIKEQYQMQGIVLENAQVLEGTIFTDIPAESSPNILLSTGESPRIGTVSIQFVRTSDGTSQGVTEKIGVTFIDVDGTLENTRLEAYDKNDQLLDVVYVPVGENGSRQYVEIEAEGIAFAKCVLAESGDGCAMDNLTFAAVPHEVFILEASPNPDWVTKLVEAFLRTQRAGKEGDTYYASNPKLKRYLSIQIGTTPEAFRQALQTPGAWVCFRGHANYGLGAIFNVNPTCISDFMNISSELVAINWRYLVEKQAYPNLWVSDEEIAVSPQNYCTPIGVQRFPNDNGVGVCESFGEVQGKGIERYHYQYFYLFSSFFDDISKLVVHGGKHDLPDNLQYAVLYYQSCNSGAYYSESFQRGVFFYTTSDSLAITHDIFLKGIFLGWNWEEMKFRMNLRFNNNDYFDFTKWTPHDPCDEDCE